jgi:hypothetical protein
MKLRRPGRNQGGRLLPGRKNYSRVAVVIYSISHGVRSWPQGDVRHAG